MAATDTQTNSGLSIWQSNGDKPKWACQSAYSLLSRPKIQAEGFLLLSRRAAQNTVYSSECHSIRKNNLLDSRSLHLCVLKYHSSKVEIISQIPTSLMFIFYSGKLVDWFGWKLAYTNKKKKTRFGLLRIHKLSELQYNILSNVLWVFLGKL